MARLALGRWAALSIAVVLVASGCSGQGDDADALADALADVTSDADTGDATVEHDTQDLPDTQDDALDADATDGAPDLDADETELGDARPPAEDLGLPPEPPALTCDLTVGTEGDVQTTVQEALVLVPEGGVVCLEAGTYVFRRQLDIAVDAITLRGAGQADTILDFKKSENGGNGIRISSDRVTIRDLTVRDPPGDGVRADEVVGLTFWRVSAIWDTVDTSDNGAYGLYPVLCKDVLIRECFAEGAKDAGIYLGQSQQALLIGNEVRGNIMGFEIENSVDVDVRENHIHDNTVGILITHLPDRPFNQSARTKLHHNLIESNNLPNFGTQVGISHVPSGLGVGIVGSDANEVHDNIVRDHGFSGLAILMGSTTIFGPFNTDEYEGWPHDNYVHDNTWVDNGTDPPDDASTMWMMNYLGLQEPLATLLVDSCAQPDAAAAGQGPNCFEEPSLSDYVDAQLCGSGEQVTGELSALTCEGTALPAVVPARARAGAR
ncbi:MAG: right-handed parallel beta-helix repeat-containing protein [Deltaproteobacteria bacterium]|nr:right-handed parallel beta-helix repeat-containing protein [Deltaproteobacteria bacterium]MCB9785136.1 right-handed parallel beta-helix repeat-containing protein [Deltaproteobacteria bacterium]